MKKRIAAVILLFCAAIAFSQPQTGGFGTGGNTGRLGPSFNSLAFFEFAPTSGAGMGSACACANITGAKGEALTFTRTGSATCSRQGLATTGIANGDLVACSTDQPRVEASGGVLGLRVEGARTNIIPRSAEVDNAIWLKEQDSAPRTPTVTANAGTAPDNTSTAERVQFPPTTGAEYSVYYQQVVTSLATGWSCSAYVRGFSGSGTTDICGYNTTGGWQCSACAFVSTGWTRCEQSRGVTSGTVGFCKLGNNSLQNGGVARSASDVLVWGHGGEEAPYATSYIPTVAAAVTRNQDRAEFALALSPTSGLCTAATIQYASLSNLPSGGNFMGPILGTGAAGSAVTTPYWWPFHSAGFLAMDTTGVMSAGSASYIPATTAATSPGRYLVRHPGGVAGFTACTNAACTTNGTTSTWGAPAFTRVLLDQAGPAAFNTAMQHIVSRVQVDPDSTRCR